MNVTDNLRITVITSSPSSSFGLISYLAQLNKLAGVLFYGAWDQEKASIAEQFKQANIAFQYSLINDIDTPMTALNAWNSQLSIVFCCREKIPMQIASIPEYGTLNFHGSPLPNYRGADPVYWQIRNGETLSALTAHQLTEELDQGAIVAQQVINIGPYDTAHRLFSNLIQAIPDLLKGIFEQLDQYGRLQKQQQLGECLHTAPRVTEVDLNINWQQITASQLCNQVRAGNPQHGGARLQMGQGHAQLLQATPSQLPNYGASPGTVIHLTPEQDLIVALSDESIRLDIIANNDGVLDGYRFAQTCYLSAGARFT
ncbi:Bifunctional polymyxin resistance protein ArnA [Marinomonas aquimarina]|uniref:Bifunctional polymyxin resistance protein ArnA n=1 Tax=Marinomonas aquimarina TaxID=295068 RepID=A0A1A8TDT2_9GAMM|nr:formyltransferase family protein [Marinomonas aquimarina]SBS31359.1 Bifunctional polymyxin resistance protein ArnA [Marinomonas aquimarina]